MDWHFFPCAGQSLQSLSDLRSVPQFSFSGELDLAVGGAVESMGPEVVLAAVPLNITGYKYDAKTTGCSTVFTVILLTFACVFLSFVFLVMTWSSLAAGWFQSSEIMWKTLASVSLLLIFSLWPLHSSKEVSYMFIEIKLLTRFSILY